LLSGGAGCESLGFSLASCENSEGLSENKQQQDNNMLDLQESINKE
jgi:hypothetical protein